MKPSGNGRPSVVRRWLVPIVVAVLATAVVIWRLADVEPPREAARADDVPDSPPAPAPRREPAPAPREPAPEATVPTSVEAAAHDALPPSHPITPEHEVIQRENQLVGALNDAMDLEDVARLRELIATYRSEYPDDVHALQEGYERIADCLEHPGEASRLAAQRYYDEKRASTLRRYVRRHCLEP